MRGIPQSNPTPFLARVRVRDFRSLADCDVTLGALTVLAGANAAGKSNFLDAVRFVRDSLVRSPAEALDERGGFGRVIRSGAGPEGVPDRFVIELDLHLPVQRETTRASDELEGETQPAREPHSKPRPRPACYAVEIGADPAGGGSHVILREHCTVEAEGGSIESFTRTPDAVTATDGIVTPSPRALQSLQGRLFLPLAALTGPILDVQSALRAMTFYDLDSAALRAVDDDTRRHTRLGEDGSHLGHVLGLLTESASRKEYLDGAMQAVVPGLLAVDELRLGDFSTVQARFWTGESANPLPFWEAVRTRRVRPGVDPHVEVFHQQQLSEGTVRAAGVLTALLQPDALSGAIPFLALEEPELAIHPSSTAALFEMADSAAAHTQVVLTTQSSDLLDDEYVRPEHLRMVEMANGVTYVGELDEHTREYLTREPSRLAEMHRQRRLRPTQLATGTT